MTSLSSNFGRQATVAQHDVPTCSSQSVSKTRLGILTVYVWLQVTSCKFAVMWSKACFRSPINLLVIRKLHTCLLLVCRVASLGAGDAAPVPKTDMPSHASSLQAAPSQGGLSKAALDMHLHGETGSRSITSGPSSLVLPPTFCGDFTSRHGVYQGHLSHTSIH